MWPDVNKIHIFCITKIGDMFSKWRSGHNIGKEARSTRVTQPNSHKVSTKHTKPNTTLFSVIVSSIKVQIEWRSKMFLHSAYFTSFK